MVPRSAASWTAVRRASSLTEADLQADVDRRRPGTSQFTSQRREPDTVRILSGVFEGKTTGTPIGLLVENEDQRSRDYEKIKDRFRPGTCGLHLPAKIRLSRLSRRRPFLGARDRDARGGRRHRAQVSARAAAGQHSRLSGADGSAGARAGGSGERLRQSVLLPGSEPGQGARGFHLAAARGGRFDRRARHRHRQGRAARAGASRCSSGSMPTWRAP